MLQFTIDEKHNGLSIRQYLRREKYFSRRIIRAIINESGAVYVNGMIKQLRDPLKTSDVLSVQLPTETIGRNMQPENIPLNILYEDDLIIILNKQPHIAVTPSFNHSSGTIANGLLAHYKQNNLPYTIHIVTRLDRDTSGVMVIAKHRYAHSLFSRIPEMIQLERHYFAILHGHLSGSGTIDQPIGRKDGSIIERTVSPTGQQSITHYSVERSTKHFSMVNVLLETGRTHQIRVHFSYKGHPIVGDDLYGGERKKINRQALHCKKVTFTHPMTRESMVFEAPLPSDLKMFKRIYVN